MLGGSRGTLGKHPLMEMVLIDAVIDRVILIKAEGGGRNASYSLKDPSDGV